MLAYKLFNSCSYFLGQISKQGFNIYFITILFAIDVTIEFSSFKINPEADKYLSNVSDLILLMQYNKALGPEIENEDKKNIKNSGFHSFLSEKDIQYPPSIFDRYIFR